MKLVKVEAGWLLSLRTTVNQISVRGAEDCSRVLGISQEIDKVLSGEGESEPHDEQRSK